MGAFLDKPKTEKETHEGEGNGLRWALSSMQGWRVSMEDAHAASTNIPGFTDLSYFAVFDGHGGSTVAKLAGTSLLPCILQQINKADTADGKVDPEVLKTAIRAGMFALDEKMRNMNSELDTGSDPSGCTAIFAFISPSHIIIANCGDSRAVLVRNDEVLFGSKDHKPSNPEETERIEAAGGFVQADRVNGNLAVSRSLGDFGFKRDRNLAPEKCQISAEPDVEIIERSDQDEFLVLACDGIWDVMSNDDIRVWVRSSLRAGVPLVEICNNTLTNCLNLNSKDNMSVVVVRFPGAPEKEEGCEPPRLAEPEPVGMDFGGPPIAGGAEGTDLSKTLANILSSGMIRFETSPSSSDDDDDDSTTQMQVQPDADEDDSGSGADVNDGDDSSSGSADQAAQDDAKDAVEQQGTDSTDVPDMKL